VLALRDFQVWFVKAVKINVLVFNYNVHLVTTITRASATGTKQPNMSQCAAKKLLTHSLVEAVTENS